MNKEFVYVVWDPFLRKIISVHRIEENARDICVKGDYKDTEKDICDWKKYYLECTEFELEE